MAPLTSGLVLNEEDRGGLKEIFELNVNSVSRSNGFNSSIYKSCWGIIESNFMKTVNDLWVKNLHIARLNYRVIALFQKVK